MVPLFHFPLIEKHFLIVVYTSGRGGGGGGGGIKFPRIFHPSPQ